MLTWLTLLLTQLPFFTLRLGSGGSFPKPLTAAEEAEYVQRLGEGDETARNVLIERNLRLVAHITKKYYSQTGDTEDLISIGTIGLIKAVNTYKADKKIRLATYAARCIENAILSLMQQRPQSPPKRQEKRQTGRKNGISSAGFPKARGFCATQRGTV